MKIELVAAKGCAWRARYLYVNDRKVAHVGVDPNDGVRPKAFGSLAGREFRFTLPYVPWHCDSGLLCLRAYKLSRLFWHKVDGRYGWGSPGRSS